jgi:transcription antitermination factor NusG
VESWPFVNKGDWVRVEKGPLAGLSGVVAECKSGLRVVVSIGLLQRSVAVEVNQSQIRPTKAPMSYAGCLS